MSARPGYLLDLAVVAELTRPAGNRRVFTLFQERQHACAIAAPTLADWVRGIETLAESPRRQALGGFLAEWLRSGPPVFAFDRDAAIWLGSEAARRVRRGRAWSPRQGQLAAIAATRELALVARSGGIFAGVDGLRIEDWFRP